MPVAFAMKHVCARVALEQSWKNRGCRGYQAMEKERNGEAQYSGKWFNTKRHDGET